MQARKPQPPMTALPESATTDLLPIDAPRISPFGSAAMMCVPATAGANNVFTEWEEDNDICSGSSNEQTTATTTATTQAKEEAPAEPAKKDAATITSFTCFKAPPLSAPAYTGWADDTAQRWEYDEGLLANACNLVDLNNGEVDEVDRSVTAPVLADSKYVPELMRMEEENATSGLHAAWRRLPPSAMEGMGSMHNQVVGMQMMNTLMMGMPLVNPMFMPPMMMGDLSDMQAMQQQQQKPEQQAEPAKDDAEEAGPKKRRRRRRRHRGRGRRGRGKNKSAAAEAGEEVEEDGSDDGDASSDGEEQQ